MKNLPLVSIIIPCRNEEKFIGKCLDSIIDNDYPKDKLEVLVIDGVSEDETKEIVKKYTQEYPFIKLLNNHKKITPCALNIGIKSSKGQIIMRMDAHATYENDYISKCVKYLDEYNADNVGGIRMTRPSNNNTIGKAIALSVSHPFAAGTAIYRTGTKKARWVDTVFGGCYRREVFSKIGFFNEDLVKGQDREFNFRLRKSGGKILLVPDIICYYYARSNLKAFCKWLFICGSTPFYATKLVGRTIFSWRNLVPSTFVLSLAFSLSFSFVFPEFLWLFLSIVSFYLLFNIYFSIKIVLKEKNIKYLLVMPLIFTTTHLLYGIGSIYGLLKLKPKKQSNV